MKKEDVKVGMRVVPHDKTPEGYCGDAIYDNDWKGFCNGNNSHKEHFKFFQENGYLYVSNIYHDSGIVCLSYDGKVTGSTFNASDFTPYIENKFQCFSGHTQGNRVIIYVNEKCGEATDNNLCKALLLAYCRATNTDTSIVDLLFKKEDKPTLRDEVVRLLKSSEFIIPAIKYYREKTNCGLLEAKLYVDKVNAQIQPTKHNVTVDGENYVKVEN